MNKSTDTYDGTFNVFIKSYCEKLRLSEAQIKEIYDIIKTHAIAAAISEPLIIDNKHLDVNAVSHLIATGLVWSTYARLNKSLDVKIEEHSSKDIEVYIICHIQQEVGTFIQEYVANTLLSYLPPRMYIPSLYPYFNSVISFVFIYVVAIIYLDLIVRLINSEEGSLCIVYSDDTRKLISDILTETDLKGIVKDGKREYNKAKAAGLIDAAKRSPKCPNCNTDIPQGQVYCSICSIKVKNRVFEDK